MNQQNKNPLVYEAINTIIKPFFIKKGYTPLIIYAPTCSSEYNNENKEHILDKNKLENILQQTLGEEKTQYVFENLQEKIPEESWYKWYKKTPPILRNIPRKIKGLRDGLSWGKFATTIDFKEIESKKLKNRIKKLVYGKHFTHPYNKEKEIPVLIWDDCHTSLDTLRSVFHEAAHCFDFLADTSKAEKMKKGQYKYYRREVFAETVADIATLLFFAKKKERENVFSDAFSFLKKNLLVNNDTYIHRGKAEGEPYDSICYYHQPLSELFLNKGLNFIQAQSSQDPFETALNFVSDIFDDETYSKKEFKEIYRLAKTIRRKRPTKLDKLNGIKLFFKKAQIKLASSLLSHVVSEKMQALFYPLDKRHNLKTRKEIADSLLKKQNEKSWFYSAAKHNFLKDYIKRTKELYQYAKEDYLPHENFNKYHKDLNNFIKTAFAPEIRMMKESDERKAR